MDAREQATKLMQEHKPATAARVAAETALSFAPGSKGREFWNEVAQWLSTWATPEEAQAGLRSTPCDWCGTPMAIAGRRRTGELHICNVCAAGEARP